MTEPTGPRADLQQSDRPPLTVLQLYPTDMNIYGDWGNALTMARRLQWAGLTPRLVRHDVGDELPENVDLVLGGGGQDSGQLRVRDDLVAQASRLRSWVEDGVPMLLVCGLYQLFGRYFLTSTGEQIEGIGALPVETRAGVGRLVGDVVVRTPAGRAVGYENHSGRTYLDDPSAAWATVVRGHGNNGEDGTEGVRVANTVGTYLHGPVLPKNPALTDELWRTAARRRFGGVPEPDPASAGAAEARRADALAAHARSVIEARG